MPPADRKRPPPAAVTEIDARGAPPAPSAELPHIAVPPHAARILVERSDVEATAPDHDTSPRVGGYALVARFPSSATADVFLGYKVTAFGFLRRAVVKWVDGRRPDRALVQENLADEARALSCVNHPNVVSIFDYAEEERGAHLAVEYVAGTDLRRCLAELGRRREVLPWDLVCFTVCEVLRGLDHIHAAADPYGVNLGIIHRDANPSNVLLGEDGRVKLTDFGTVLMAGRAQRQTAPGMVKGKVRYLAPEYIAEQTCTHQVDVYGTGVMLYEMLAGQPSFSQGSSVDVMIRIVREGLSLAPLAPMGIPPGLVEIVRRATDRNPAFRYPTASAMLDAIEQFCAHEGYFTSPTRLAAHLRARDLFC